MAPVNGGFSCGETGCPEVQDQGKAILEIQVDRRGSKEILRSLQSDVKEIFKRLNVIEIRLYSFVGIIVAAIDLLVKYLPGGR